MTEIVHLIETLFHSGMGGTYAMILIIMAIYSYFKFLKPYLQDFNEMKQFLISVPASHIKFNKRLDKIEDIIIESKKEIMSLDRDLFRDYNSNNDKLHIDIVVDLNRLRESISSLLDGGVVMSTKNEENFKNILIELVKLESRIEFMNGSPYKGLQK